MNERYMQRGVSASKEDVHRAISSLDKGLFPKAFCKIVEDLLEKVLGVLIVLRFGIDGELCETPAVIHPLEEIDDGPAEGDVAIVLRQRCSGGQAASGRRSKEGGVDVRERRAVGETGGLADHQRDQPAGVAGATSALPASRRPRL
jgi:hypothetical protein